MNYYFLILLIGNVECKYCFIITLMLIEIGVFFFHINNYFYKKCYFNVQVLMYVLQNQIFIYAFFFISVHVILILFVVHLL